MESNDSKIVTFIFLSALQYGSNISDPDKHLKKENNLTL